MKEILFMAETSTQHHQTSQILASLLLMIAACALFFMIGKGNSDKEKQNLYRLNRSELEHLDVGGEPIYVIGHRSPDADTVSCAIAYAELMQKLGYTAEARITAPIDRETAYIMQDAGADTPPVLLDAAGQNIILVDHSDYAQAAEGMKDANIIAIIDHHGVGSVTTGKAIIYDARPIGAAATIVWMRYMNYGVEMEKKTAHLLLGAILSDTANLTGTATTTADKEAAAALAKIAGVTDVNAFYAGLHAEKLSYEGFSSEEILFSDYKEYSAGGTTFGIGLMNAIDEKTAAELAGRMKEVFPSAAKTKNVDLIYAAITIRENGEKIDYIVPGDEHSKEVFEETFPNYDEYDGTSFIFRTGLGRKTKFVPGLTEHLNLYPKE